MKLTRGQIHYLNGLLEAFDEFSDGAWGGACQDEIREDEMFRRMGPYEVWMAWMEATSEDTKEGSE